MMLKSSKNTQEQCQDPFNRESVATSLVNITSGQVASKEVDEVSATKGSGNVQSVHERKAWGRKEEEFLGSNPQDSSQNVFCYEEVSFQ